MSQTTHSLFKETLQLYNEKEIASKLNVVVGTVKRWKELNNVPSNYHFDFLRILSREICYSKFSVKEKDQFFTPNDVVHYCWNVFRNKIDKIDNYTFIEPSAGDGSFLKVLPKNTIALDIEPMQKDILKMDYLLWSPTSNSKKYIVFGNPPFGLRGHLALQFINHSYKFADFVCFILPQLFESDGKGSPRKRVIGYNLIHSEKLSSTYFYYPNKTNVNVNVVFQIWSKHLSSPPEYNIKASNQDILKVYSLSDGGTVSTIRNKKMINKCDIYLPSTCFGNAMKVYSSFYDLPNHKGYGVVFLKNKTDMIKKSYSIDWKSVGFLSTNSAINLRTSLIVAQFI
jgi:hypothetical protein